MKTLVFQRSQVAQFLTLDTCIAAVESAFRMSGEGSAGTPGVQGVHAEDGGFHIKAGILPLNLATSLLRSTGQEIDLFS